MTVEALTQGPVAGRAAVARPGTLPDLFDGAEPQGYDGTDHLPLGHLQAPAHHPLGAGLAIAIGSATIHKSGIRGGAGSSS